MTNLIKVPAAALFFTLFSLPAFATGDKEKTSSETVITTSGMETIGRCSSYPECNKRFTGN
ncbi:hypothetical protein [Salinimonas iocasae]|uniref:Uncharacterized protein n=1 Tax=Salinimonas iocasae TaxID=2572577 RepID=A0A5B7YA29_9ALTE|nr:hypothetical protein [Salinimonas iocasae]QCZ92627.1 hypothetical protein FBQ74_03695 [Salinimonas iocasae]